MPEPLRAKSISVRCCEHGQISVCMHAENGGVQAIAFMDAATAADFLDSFGDACLEAIKILREALTGDPPQGAH